MEKSSDSKHFGFYVIIQLQKLGDCIGGGGCGKVFKGLNIKTGTTVAIKKISLENIKKDQRESIQLEIELLKKLDHPNIVHYIDSIATKHSLNIVLEYVENGSLQNIIQRYGKFDEHLAQIFIEQTLRGLIFLHSQGIIHRDIKGANILANKKGKVKLADFGLATKLTEDQTKMSFAGTPYWMAPEIIGMNGTVSTACDIWSLGCTILELVTGKPPYYDLNKLCAMMKIVQEDQPPYPTTLSKDLKDFLNKCFQKEPQQRASAIDLLKHPWIRMSIAKKEVVKEPKQEIVQKQLQLNSDKPKEDLELSGNRKLYFHNEEHNHSASSSSTQSKVQQNIKKQQIVRQQKRLIQPTKTIEDEESKDMSKLQNKSKSQDVIQIVPSSQQKPNMSSTCQDQFENKSGHQFKSTATTSQNLNGSGGYIFTEGIQKSGGEANDYYLNTINSSRMQNKYIHRKILENKQSDPTSIDFNSLAVNRDMHNRQLQNQKKTSDYFKKQRMVGPMILQCESGGEEDFYEYFNDKQEEINQCVQQLIQESLTHSKQKIKVSATQTSQSIDNTVDINDNLNILIIRLVR